jgi:F0F1-type ATP synthase membrane subunit c/vacuolar-type H+-ATPase subunit K
MDTFFRYWLRWPSLEVLMAQPGAWAMCETLHFIGLCLLIGIVGLFDLRVLGMGRGLPPVALKRLLPWGVLGFGLCAGTGALFVGGIGANLIGDNAYDVIARDGWLQWKLVFIALAGINLAAYYVTGMSRAVDALDATGDAPVLAKLFAGASLCLWIGVIVFGRLIPEGL